MPLCEATIKGRKLYFCKPNEFGSANSFTLIIGKNGHGKSTILREICLIFLNSIVHTSDSKYFGVQRNSFSTYHSDKKSSSGFGEIVYESKAGTIVIEVATNPIHPLNIQHPEEMSTAELIRITESYEELQQKQIPKVKIKFSQGEQHPDKKTFNIVAVSSSPFDKFPILSDFFPTPVRLDIGRIYAYKGSREMGSYSPRNHFELKMKQAGNYFANFLLSRDREKSELIPLFDLLQLNSRLTIKFKTSSPFIFEAYKKKEDVRNIINRAISSTRNPELEGYVFSEEKNNAVESSLKKITETFTQDFDSYYIDREGYPFEIDILSKDITMLLTEVATLAECGIFIVEDIQFSKKGKSTNFMLSEASSGELCLIFNTISIASSIEDNSVILIDEPEISLHPDWQRQFLPLLKTSFEKYNNCHFIIATHSPQLASSLGPKNSYILNLDELTTEIVSGHQTDKRSADYQLACVFRTPGHHNEYLITRITDLLSQIQDGIQLNEEFKKDLMELMEFYELVPEGDPVQKLLNILNQVFRSLKK